MMGKFGADAVQMATRFVLTKECDVADNFKKAYLNARKEDVVLIKSPSGCPAARSGTVPGALFSGGTSTTGVSPGLPEKLQPHLLHHRPPRHVAQRRHGGGLVFTARTSGDQGHPSVKELIDRLVAEAESVYSAASAVASA